MRHYPIFLNLRGRTVLIVGAGTVAAQKIAGLEQSGARIHVVAPGALPGIRKQAAQKKITWLRRPYQTSDLKQVDLVIAATDDPVLQKKVSADARERKIWTNVVDAPALCGFIAPAVVRRGAIQIAISTGGASPALAKRIRQQLESTIGPEYGRLARFLQRRRPALLKLNRFRRKSAFERYYKELTHGKSAV